MTLKKLFSKDNGVKNGKERWWKKAGRLDTEHVLKTPFKHSPLGLMDSSLWLDPNKFTSIHPPNILMRKIIVSLSLCNLTLTHI